VPCYDCRTERGATGMVHTYSGTGHSPQARAPGTHACMRDGAAAAWAMNRLRRLALPPSPGWAPPLPSWRGVGSAQPARLPLFPSLAVADQAPGVAGAEQLRAREALQPDTLGPIFALRPGAVLDREVRVPLAAAPVSLKRAGAASGAMAGCRGLAVAVAGCV
jgi:hypothetical protein